MLNTAFELETHPYETEHYNYRSEDVPRLFTQTRFFAQVVTQSNGVDTGGLVLFAEPWLNLSYV